MITGPQISQSETVGPAGAQEMSRTVRHDAAAELSCGLQDVPLPNTAFRQ